MILKAIPILQHVFQIPATYTFFGLASDRNDLENIVHEVCHGITFRFDRKYFDKELATTVYERFEELSKSVQDLYEIRSIAVEFHVFDRLRFGSASIRRTIAKSAFQNASAYKNKARWFEAITREYNDPASIRDAQRVLNLLDDVILRWKADLMKHSCDGDPECTNHATSACLCRRCAREPEDERFYTCQAHKAAASEKHQRIRGYPTEWSGYAD